jgi:CheY-like chemotaxis protein
MPSPAGRLNEEVLLHCLQECRNYVAELKGELRHINDEDLQPKVLALTTIAENVLKNNEDVLTSTIADDLASLMSAIRNFKISSSDPELGRTFTLDRLRSRKGLIMIGLIEAIEAADKLGLQPTHPSLLHQTGAKLSRAGIEGLLRSLNDRMESVEDSLQVLEVQPEPPTKFAQQRALLEYYIASMRAQMQLAKLQSRIGTTIDLEAIGRAVELMSEFTRDFVATVSAWAGRISGEIITISRNIADKVNRVSSGVRAIINYILRKDKQSSAEPDLASLELPAKFPADLAQSISEHLPLLRSYAKALAGDQTSGDMVVSATLEALLRRPTIIKSETRDQVALYKLFTAIGKEVGLPAPEEPSDKYFLRLHRLPVHVREAFLLRFLVDFGVPETLEILALSNDDTQKLVGIVGIVGRELATELATDILIIEDDTFIAMELETLMQRLGHRIIGTARTHTQAIAMIKIKKPRLILADIQLADGSSGMEAVNEILLSCSPVVIFVTAYPERFLSGDRPEPAFLIAKPFQPWTVEQVVTQGLFFERNAKPRTRGTI